MWARAAWGAMGAVWILALAGLAQAEEPVTSHEDIGKRRVLVTAFDDWEDLGSPPAIHRCRDNPSCRLLVGDPESEASPAMDGPLVEALRADAGALDYRFRTLTTTWGAFEALDLGDFDVVIGLGLGVYHDERSIYVERGAFNRRSGRDAAGRSAEPRIDVGASDVLRPPGSTGIPDRLEAIDGRRFGDYRVVVKDARRSNAFLCNETHYEALRALERSRARGGALDQVFFVHIPYARNEDYERLAGGVAGVIRALLGLEGAR